MFCNIDRIAAIATPSPDKSKMPARCSFWLKRNFCIFVVFSLLDRIHVPSSSSGRFPEIKPNISNAVKRKILKKAFKGNNMYGECTYLLSFCADMILQPF